MDLEQIEAVLMEALGLRLPVFTPLERGRGRVDALQDYMLASAHMNGRLVEARHWLREVEQVLGDRWQNLEGWEVALRVRRERATVAQVEEAKTKVQPTLHAARRRARLLRESVCDQIARLERDERVCSRAYTMIVGE